MIDSIILWIVVLVRDCIGSSNRIGTSTAHRQIIAWHSHNHRLCSLVKRWRSIWEKKQSEVRSVSASIFHHVRTPQYVSASALSTNIDVDDVASMFTVGLAAGIIGTLLGFPLDLVKTRWAELLMQHTCMNQYRISQCCSSTNNSLQNANSAIISIFHDEAVLDNTPTSTHIPNGRYI